jgi:nitroreductase
MDFLKLAAERYSVRSFSDQPVKNEKIEKILQAAHLAPTGCNYQPQRILVIREAEAVEKLRRCSRSHFNAPMAMLVCCNTEECWKRTRYDGRASGVVDASIVATHMMLEAFTLGLGTTWVMHFDPEAMRREFAIPDHIDPIALLVMGYPAPDAEPHRYHSEFRPIEEVVVYASFA